MPVTGMGRSQGWRHGLAMLSLAGGLVAGGAIAQGAPPQREVRTFTISNGCTGEQVACEGFVLTKIQGFKDRRGAQHDNFLELEISSCVGLTSGDPYRLIEVDSDKRNAHALGDGAITLAQESRFLFVRPGEEVEGDDLFLVARAHNIFNANGESVLAFDIFESECR